MAHAGSGPVLAVQQAYAQLMGMIERQAALLSYINAFWMGALIVACLIPLPFFLKKPKPGAGAVSAH
jgi:DHA2 family multidrug resistance protein